MEILYFWGHTNIKYHIIYQYARFRGQWARIEGGWKDITAALFLRDRGVQVKFGFVCSGQFLSLSP